MDTTFSFLGLTGHAYGLCAAVAAAVLLSGTRLAGRKLPAGTVRLFGALGIPFAVIGARLLYCLCNMALFTETFENPWLMLCFFDGGLSMPGAIIGLLLAALLTAKVQRIRSAMLLDAASVPFGLAMAVLRFGEQYTDLGLGKAVDEGFATASLPWLFQQSRMGVAIEYRLNVWMYEVITGILIFAVTLLLLRTLRHRGRNTALFVFSLYGATQVLWESMRDDGHMLIIFLRIGQLAAAFMPLIACGILSRRKGCRIRRIAVWCVMALCVAGLVLLEFSLDGRVTWGNPSLLRDYSLMALLCTAMFAMPCLLLFEKDASCSTR